VSILIGASSKTRFAEVVSGEMGLVSDVEDLGCGAGRIAWVECGGDNDSGTFAGEGGASADHCNDDFESPFSPSYQHFRPSISL
jgi:hypothetical protein